MRKPKFAVGVLIGGLMLGTAAMPAPTTARADTPPEPTARQKLREHWENTVVFYGDEESGEWSLRVQDKDVHERAWFEYLELWHYNRDEKRWEQIKIDKFQKPIVLPKQKTSDQPEDSQTLVELKEIEPHTAGVWYAKWKADDIECGTLMRVGSGRSTNHLQGDAQEGMIKMVVPIDLNKSEQLWVPDPRVYCINGGPGKPEPKGKKADAGKAEK